MNQAQLDTFKRKIKTNDRLLREIDKKLAKLKEKDEKQKERETPMFKLIYQNQCHAIRHILKGESKDCIECEKARKQEIELKDSPVMNQIIESLVFEITGVK